MINAPAMKKLIALALAFAPFAAFANAGAGLEPAQTNVANAASLQRGARMYMNYCSGCHSLEYVRYSRVAEDLGLTEEQAMRNLNFTGAKFGETIRASMPRLWKPLHRKAPMPGIRKARKSGSLAVSSAVCASQRCEVRRCDAERTRPSAARTAWWAPCCAATTAAAG